MNLASTAVVGAGAVGSYFGALLARSGHPVTLIGRPAHVRAIERDGLRVEFSDGRAERVRLGASSELAAVRGAALVLVCVKATDTAAIARELAPLLDPGATVLSLQNGVDNAATLARTLTQTVVPAVVYVATSLPEPGTVRHHGRGDLVIGRLDRHAPADAALTATLQGVVDLFGAAQVPVRISDDVVGELWQKLLVNCAYNAISALVQWPYGRISALDEVRALQREVVREVVAVAQADGQTLAFEASLDAMTKIAAAMPAQFSSTAQDLARGKPTEIDHLNGFVAARGAALGIATPANQALHALVRLAQAKRAEASDDATPPAAAAPR